MNSLRFLFSALLLGVFFSASAQTTGMVKKTAAPVAAAAQTGTFQVLGNCGMCKKTIEKAATAAGAAAADWDMEKDLLTVQFDAAKTSVDAIQKAVARAGYDNAGYKAPDEAYNSLHACCQYDRSGAPGTAKTCTTESGE